MSQGYRHNIDTKNEKFLSYYPQIGKCLPFLGGQTKLVVCEQFSEYLLCVMRRLA